MIANTKRSAERAFHLFKLVEGLPLKGFERSFKMTERKILWNRFLFGVDRKSISEQQLVELCTRLDMPPNLTEPFIENLESASQVLFGFEESDQRSIYKLYLEYWERIRRDIRNKMNPKEPVVMHIGYKWDTEAPEISAITKYTCYPLLTNLEILTKLSGIYSGNEHLPTYKASNDIISLAALRAPDPSLIYLEVGEAGNPRKSFDINLYKTGILVEEIYPMIETICGHYGIPVNNIEKGIIRIGKKLLGHIAGGIHRNGKDFFTVYYEEDESVIEPPQSRKVGRNEPCPCGSGKKYKICCGR